MTQLQKLTDQAESAAVSNIPVSSFMDTSPVFLSPNSSVKHAIQIFSAEKVSGAPVLDATNRLLGMISEYDLLLQAATQDLDSPVSYKTEIIGLKPSDTLKEALVLLYRNKLRRLPVVDQNGVLVGVVSRIDVLNRLVGQAEKPETEETAEP
ncbi:MAG: hypothetical protein A2070_10995 [Bdellovibrionales bacterium GWC1_52_8]|nr:MAG: hypothetical protein A2Z97_11440 [Bdellovibrionales bacterium GWB1_52_6]OFZ03868.1 MAG: hypothetical protein A2X97_15830 [Bdellovibrionales bacterium GWA1_52_35]OFZ40286.1 MAG: hypothetical protein A2070_10995 [Bdellovibrionales bacterium GWC1_52_8]HCM39697.1 hypothetical protein [Bdellovibrionales bacterium]